MKQLFKKHAMFLVALIIAVGTMSFKLNSNSVADGWYAVHTDEETILGPTNAPLTTDQCRTSKSTELCKIQVQGSEAPSSVSQAREDDMIQSEAFRSN